MKHFRGGNTQNPDPEDEDIFGNPLPNTLCRKYPRGLKPLTLHNIMISRAEPMSYMKQNTGVQEKLKGKKPRGRVGRRWQKDIK